MRVCGEPDCPELTHATRCHMHRREREQLRGTRQARGYGAAHVATRDAWVPIVAAGHVPCARCGELITPGSSWDLGHHDTDRATYTGPEHAACNRATAGR